MEAVTVRGLEKGVHLGVRGEFGGSWNWDSDGGKSCWERRKLERGLDRIM